MLRVSNLHTSRGRNRNEPAVLVRMMTNVRVSLGLLSTMWFCVLAVLSVTAVYAGGQTSKNKDLILTKSDGTQIRVPGSGPLANQTAQEVALGILEFDKQKKSHPPGERAVNPQVAEAIRQMAEESRNEALEQLDLTYRVAQETSGPLDTQVLKSAKENVDLLWEIMRGPPPPNLNVHTEISASTPNAMLHYCLRSDYTRNICAWHSYSLGALMPIGRYMFRVESVEAGGKAQEEEVLVLNEPTKLMILPMH